MRHYKTRIHTKRKNRVKPSCMTLCELCENEDLKHLLSIYTLEEIREYIIELSLYLISQHEDEDLSRLGTFAHIINNYLRKILEG